MNVAVIVFYCCLAVYVSVLVVFRIRKGVKERNKVKKQVDEAINLENNALKLDDEKREKQDSETKD